MPRMRWVALSCAIVAGAMVLGACGSGSSSSKDKTATASAGASSGGDKTASGGNSSPAAGKTSGAGATVQATSDGGGNGGNVDDVKAAAKKFGESTFKATYKLSGGGTDIFSDGQLVLEKQGKEKFRFDVTTKQAGKDTALIFIESPDASAFCLKDAGEFGALFGIETGQGVCFKSDPKDTNNPLGGLSQSITDLENQNVTVLDTSTKNVAGQDSKCYRTKDNNTSEITTTCFANDGVILYAQTEGDNASTIEAQSVSKDVNADDFKLPYEVRELPNIAGDGTNTAP